MTMRLYANRKGFPLERASTTVQHEKVPDMMPPDRFTRTIVLDGPLSDDQRARILEIADRCPVDLTLVRGSDVQTELSSTSQAADPTRLASPWRLQRKAKGSDVGPSYRSAIFYTTEAQMEVALATIAEIEASGCWPGPDRVGNQSGRTLLGGGARASRIPSALSWGL